MLRCSETQCTFLFSGYNNRLWFSGIHNEAGSTEYNARPWFSEFQCRIFILRNVILIKWYTTQHFDSMKHLTELWSSGLKHHSLIPWHALLNTDPVIFNRHFDSVSHCTEHWTSRILYDTLIQWHTVRNIDPIVYHKTVGFSDTSLGTPILWYTIQDFSRQCSTFEIWPQFCQIFLEETISKINQQQIYSIFLVPLTLQISLSG